MDEIEVVTDCACSDLFALDAFATAAAGRIVFPDTVFKMLAIVSGLLMLSPCDGITVSNVMVDIVLAEVAGVVVITVPLASVLIEDPGGAVLELIDDIIERTCWDTFIAFKVSSFGWERGESCGIAETTRCPAGPRMGLFEFSLDLEMTCTGMTPCFLISLECESFEPSWGAIGWLSTSVAEAREASSIVASTFSNPRWSESSCPMELSGEMESSSNILVGNEVS